MSDIISKSEMKRLGTLDPKIVTEEYFKLKAERDRYKQALEFIADPTTSPAHAYEKAREALRSDTLAEKDEK